MTRLNPGNERIKFRYVHHLAEGEGLSTKTVEHTMLAIEAFERFTDRKDFKLFRRTSAEAFRKHLLSADPPASLRTVHSKVTRLAKFFRWLSDEPGFHHVRASDAKFFALNRRDQRIMQETPVKRGPSVSELQQLVRRMPTSTPRECRDRALVALIALTGIRIGAAISLKVRHVRADGLGINQNGAEVRTKQGRSFTSVFLPLGKDLCGIIPNYVRLLRTEWGFTDNDPLFPAANQLAGLGQGSLCDVAKVHWKTDGPARKIVKQAFDAAGLPYFTPHTLRNTLANFGLSVAPDIETWVALSQNLGHKSPMTALKAYVSIHPDEQIALIQKLHHKSLDDDLEEQMKRLSATLAAKRLRDSHHD